MTNASVSGRIALVTGGGGIGKARTLTPAAAGSDVALNDVSREADARLTSVCSA